MARSDGSTASYYELPPESKELQDLIAFKNMNAQIGEIFRACYRYGQVDHSDKLRDIKKILFYAQAELDRIVMYELVEIIEAQEDKSPNEQMQEFLIEPMPSEVERKLPTCSKCNREISGRVYYLGNAPRCKQHAL